MCASTTADWKRGLSMSVGLAVDELEVALADELTLSVGWELALLLLEALVEVELGWTKTVEVLAALVMPWVEVI